MSKSSSSSAGLSQKNKTRIHPYAQQQQQRNVSASASNINMGLTRRKSTTTTTTATKTKTHINDNYDDLDFYQEQDYLNGRTSVKAMASNTKGILKNSTNKMSSNPPAPYKTNSKSSRVYSAASSSSNYKNDNNNKLASYIQNTNNKEDIDKLKFLSGNTSSIEHFARKFHQIEVMSRGSSSASGRNKTSSNSHSHLKLIGNHLFELIGTLDCSITSGDENSLSSDLKQLKVKDAYGSLHCNLYETERILPKIVRGSLIRCLGKYNLRDSTFQCVSVRKANSAELAEFNENTRKTNLFLSASKYA
jgi:hypothetical protein